MRKLICTFCLIFVSVLAFAVDETWTVELSVDHPQESSDKFGFCEIRVSFQPSETDGQGMVNIDIENRTSKYLLVFNKDYTEKELKAMQYPSYRFDKKGNWGTHSSNLEVIGFKDLSRIIMREATTGPEALVAYNLTDGEEKQVEIPIYLASRKGANRLMIEEMHIVRLDITIHTKKDELLPVLTQRCDELLKEIEGVTFYDCPWAGQRGRKSHYSSVKTQQKEYADKIASLKKEIEEGRNQYQSSEKKYAEYQELYDQLNAVRLDNHIAECRQKHTGGGGGVPNPNGEPCEWDRKYGHIASVGNEMEKLYIKYDNGDKNAKSQAQGLYNAMKSKCTVLGKKWNAKDREKAERYYNRMK